MILTGDYDLPMRVVSVASIHAGSTIQPIYWCLGTRQEKDDGEVIVGGLAARILDQAVESILRYKIEWMY